MHMHYAIRASSAVAVLAVLIAAIGMMPTKAQSDGVIPGQYIVVFKPGAGDSDAVRADLTRRHGGEEGDTYHSAIRGYSARLTQAERDAIARDPRVAFVSEDRVVSIADGRPGQELSAAARSTRTGGKTTPPPPQVLPTGVNRTDAELDANKGAGVQVAVIDTGIYTSHPDLANNVLGGYNCTTATRSAYVDQNGHGTHVAGTIAAIDNTQGVVGVAPQAKLWAVRVLDRNGSGTWSSVICGIDWVTTHAPANGGNITVANMSLGGTGTSDNNCGATNNDALHAAICRARDAGVTFVVAAGNNGANAASFVPAAYSDVVIAVSALADSDGVSGGFGGSTSYGADDTFASFSNYGAPVAIGAPGVNIYSTWLNNGYNTISGTSMASPHVAGAAALYVASHPGATWTAVKSALTAAGEALGAGHTDPSGKHPEPVLRAASL